MTEFLREKRTIQTNVVAAFSEISIPYGDFEGLLGQLSLLYAIGEFLTINTASFELKCNLQFNQRFLYLHLRLFTIVNGFTCVTVHVKKNDRKKPNKITQHNRNGIELM